MAKSALIIQILPGHHALRCGSVDTVARGERLGLYRRVNAGIVLGFAIRRLASL